MCRIRKCEHGARNIGSSSFCECPVLVPQPLVAAFEEEYKSAGQRVGRIFAWIVVEGRRRNKGSQDLYTLERPSEG